MDIDTILRCVGVIVFVVLCVCCVPKIFRLTVKEWRTHSGNNNKTVWASIAAFAIGGMGAVAISTVLLIPTGYGVVIPIFAALFFFLYGLPSFILGVLLMRAFNVLGKSYWISLLTGALWVISFSYTINLFEKHHSTSEYIYLTCLSLIIYIGLIGLDRAVHAYSGASTGEGIRLYIQVGSKIYSKLFSIALPMFVIVMIHLLLCVSLMFWVLTTSYKGDGYIPNRLQTDVLLADILFFPSNLLHRLFSIGYKGDGSKILVSGMVYALIYLCLRSLFGFKRFRSKDNESDEY